ncbi:phage tail assembly protein [Lentzea chajnantorensis]
MGTRKTFAQLQAEADDRYGNYEIELDNGDVAVLLPLLRLPDSKRDHIEKLLGQIIELQDTPKGEDTKGRSAQLRTAVREFFRQVAQTKKPVDELLRRCGDDLGLLLTLIEDFVAATQAGEASTSPS